MEPARFAVLAALSGTVALAGWGAAVVGGLGSSGIENTVTLIKKNPATAAAASVSAAPTSVTALLSVAMNSVAAVATFPLDPPEPAGVLPAVSVADVPIVEPDPPETRVQVASAVASDPLKEYPNSAVRPIETPDKCLVVDTCIDDYLWSLYERTPKIDTNKITERIKATVKKKGKTRTVTKTVAKYVLADFAWKDPIAAEKAGMSLRDYVIGGMDRSFRLKLYRALRAMDEAGHMPGITSAFRDNYRQSIASGNKAASDSSYHGGSRRGGYGHGLAADLVSVKGQTRSERYGASEELWKWIDAHEKELGIGRPYRDRDPPHVGPMDGKEYADKRGQAKVQNAALQTKNAQKPKLKTKKPQLAGHHDPVATKRAKPAKSSKVSSLPNPANVQR